MSEGGAHPAGVKHPFDYTTSSSPSFSNYSYDSRSKKSYWLLKNVVLVIFASILCANFGGVKCENSNSMYNFVHDHTNCNHRHPRPHEVRPISTFYYLSILEISIS